MKEKLEIILKAIGEKKGEDILVFAFSSLNPAVDEVVIASASNQRQVFALADNVKDRLAEHGMPGQPLDPDRRLRHHRTYL